MSVLTYPDVFRYQDEVIVGIDPGTEYVGITFLYINPSNRVVTRIEPITLQASLLRQLHQPYTDCNNEEWGRIDRINNLVASIDRLLKCKNVLAVGMEAAFMNLKRPDAFRALVEFTTVFKQVIHYQVNYFSPLEVKSSVDVKYTQLKDGMANAIKTNPDIIRLTYGGIELASEHAIDATAIALCLFRYHYPGGIL